MKNPPVVDSLVEKIVAAVHPLKIILFGSVSRGDALEDSDLDLLVVMPSGVHRRRVAQELYRRINGAGRPFDILVATPDDLEKHGDNIGLIFARILREGKEIYAA